MPGRTVSVHIGVALADRLRARATKNQRTVSQEIKARLVASMESDDYTSAAAERGRILLRGKLENGEDFTVSSTVSSVVPIGDHSKLATLSVVSD